MLKIESLNFGFKNKIICQNLCMDFKENHITGIVGKNGVGKTSLFRVLAGIYPIKEQALQFQGGKLDKKSVSFLPTDPFFYSYMTGEEYIDIVLEDPEVRRTCKDLVISLNIPLNVLTDVYSTGMKKKLAFAVAISQKREILILDEPFNGVDLDGNEKIESLILEQKETKTIIVSSHMLTSMTDFCDSIYFIEEGFNIQLYQKNEFDQLKLDIRSSR